MKPYTIPHMSSAVRDLTALARSTKHRAFVAYKKVRYPLSMRLEPAHRALYQRFPYRYRPEDFPGMDLGAKARAGTPTRTPVDRVIYTFWTGDNELTPNRRRSLDAMRRLNEPAGVRV